MDLYPVLEEAWRAANGRWELQPSYVLGDRFTIWAEAQPPTHPASMGRVSYVIVATIWLLFTSHFTVAASRGHARRHGRDVSSAAMKRVETSKATKAATRAPCSDLESAKEESYDYD